MRKADGKKRLQSMMPAYTEADLVLFQDEAEIGAPQHDNNPYAFKLYAIQRALEGGYELIFYVDASVYPIKSIKPIFDIIERDGFFMQHSGQVVGQWTNDRTLQYFHLDRDQAMTMEMYGNAGLLGLNFGHPVAQEFFKRWWEAMLDGQFIGTWGNLDRGQSADPRCFGHRHDMSVGSIIAHQLGMNTGFQDGDKWLEYSAPHPKPKNDSVLLKAHPEL
jgi:hypothetical protein